MGDEIVLKDVNGVEFRAPLWSTLARVGERLLVGEPYKSPRTRRRNVSVPCSSGELGFLVVENPEDGP